MNKFDVKKLFWQLVNMIENCCDSITKEESGNVIERGMMLSNDYSIMYVLNDGAIRLYDNEHSIIAEYTEESEELLMLKDLFEYLTADEA